MRKRYTGAFIVRWQDINGEEHSKSYVSWSLAQKAVRWLAENKMLNIDIAVKK